MHPITYNKMPTKILIHCKKNSKLGFQLIMRTRMIEKEERKITVINDWIQNIHIYGHACQSNKNGI